MRNKVFLPLAALLIAFFGAATADAEVGRNKEPVKDKDALIRELIEVTQTKELSDTVLIGLLNEMEQNFDEMFINYLGGEDAVDRFDPNVQKKIRESREYFMKRFEELFPARVRFGELVEEVSSKLYDRYFTTEEIKELLVFYKTPTGRKSLDVMPKLFHDCFTITNAVILREATALTEEIMAEIVERGGSI